MARQLDETRIIHAGKKQIVLYLGQEWQRRKDSRGGCKGGGLGP